MTQQNERFPRYTDDPSGRNIRADRQRPAPQTSVRDSLRRDRRPRQVDDDVVTPSGAGRETSASEGVVQYRDRREAS